MKYRARYFRIESNIKLTDGEKLDPISFEVSERDEEKAYLEQADKSWPNPALIYTNCEGKRPETGQDVIYDLMILKVW